MFYKGRRRCLKAGLEEELDRMLEKQGINKALNIEIRKSKVNLKISLTDLRPDFLWVFLIA